MSPSPSLLLVSSHPEDIAFVTQIAMSLQMTLRHTSSLEEGVAILLNEKPSALFFDASDESRFSQLEKAIQETVGMFSDQINPNTMFYISSKKIQKAQTLMKSPIFGHYLYRNYGNVVESGQHFSRIVAASQQDRSFLLEKILGPKAKVQVIPLKVTTQKQDAVEAVKNYLLAAKFQSRMAMVIANAVDEILMNAMFDAPSDELGRHLFGTTARSAAIQLEGQHAVELHVGFDGKYVAFTAVDLFGSIDKGRLLNHISKLYTDDEYKVRSTTAGAGIGLATVFRSGGSLMFASESRTRTEVTVFFKKTHTFKDFKEQFHFLSTQFYFG